MARPRRPKPKESGRRTKKKVSILNTESIEYVDWKDVNLLRRFQSDRAKIRARRVTGNDTQQQRQVAVAIRNAR
ncbi:MAG: 30S ribosomal protein S18, partial [Microthrixaceae bacterium]|nr:30S ribosomal protein S18 [Microthrixaceae bacterium]